MPDVLRLQDSCPASLKIRSGTQSMFSYALDAGTGAMREGVPSEKRHNKTRVPSGEGLHSWGRLNFRACCGAPKASALPI